MNEKIIRQAVNTPKRYQHKNAHCWAELIALYEDGTWEVLFEYRWDDPFNIKMFNTGRIRGLSREDAIIKLEKDYYSDKIKGIFMS